MVNLLPDTLKRELRTDYYIRFATIASILLALLAVIALILLVPSYLLASGKLSAARVHTDATEKLLALHKETPSTAELARSAEEVRVLSESLLRQSVRSLVAEIVSVRGTVSLSGIFVDIPKDGGENAALRIHGKAPTRDALLTFLASVRSLPDVANADVPVSDLVSGREIPFTLTAHWKRVSTP